MFYVLTTRISFVATSQYIFLYQVPMVRSFDQSIIDQQGNLMQILFVAGLNCFIHKQVHSYKYYECSQAEC